MITLASILAFLSTPAAATIGMLISGILGTFLGKHITTKAGQDNFKDAAKLVAVVAAGLSTIPLAAPVEPVTSSPVVEPTPTVSQD